ncbi:MAG TPA: CBS domain-containing protein [Herpetosiphonaceae bacterium]
MHNTVVAVAPSAPLSLINRLFAEQNASHLLVIDQGQLVGIITERNIQRAMWSSNLPIHLAVSGAHYETAIAGEIMTRMPVTIDASASILHAAELLIKQRVDALPVLADGLLVGLLSEQAMSRAMVAYARQAADTYHLKQPAAANVGLVY